MDDGILLIPLNNKDRKEGELSIMLQRFNYDLNASMGAVLHKLEWTNCVWWMADEVWHESNSKHCRSWWHPGGEELHMLVCGTYPRRIPDLGGVPEWVQLQHIVVLPTCLIFLCPHLGIIE